MTDLRCDGTLPDGKPCGKLIGRGEVFHLEVKCPKCAKMLRFTRPRVATYASKAFR